MFYNIYSYEKAVPFLPASWLFSGSQPETDLPAGSELLLRAAPFASWETKAAPLKSTFFKKCLKLSGLS